MSSVEAYFTKNNGYSIEVLLLGIFFFLVSTIRESFYFSSTMFLFKFK